MRNKPKEYGGKIIRSVISDLRDAKVTLPINSHIHIASSAGLDSTALLVLLTKYGHRVVPKSKINVIHINHFWRGEESNGDALYLKILCKELQIPLKVIKKPTKKTLKQGESLEDRARLDRKAVFKKLKKSKYIFTAHQANDRIETVLWRFFTGSFFNETAGIKTIEGNEIRPLLSVPREWLENFLVEEGIAARVDLSNFDERFLRARIRKYLIPAVKLIFPNFDAHLLRYASHFEKTSSTLSKDSIIDFAASRISGASVRGIKTKLKTAQTGHFSWDIGQGKRIELKQNKSEKTLTLKTSVLR